MSLDNMARQRPSTTATIAGLEDTSGIRFSSKWRQTAQCPMNCRSIVHMSRRTVPPKAQKGAFAQAIGTSRGGRTSKIHCLADDCGRAVAFALTPGNVADIKMAIPLLERSKPDKRLIADKAYDADSLRNWLKQNKINPVIPSTAARKTPYPLDRKAYKRRNVIERLFCRLKNWRRIATRYDRLARNYLAAVAIVSAIIAWI